MKRPDKPKGYIGTGCRRGRFAGLRRQPAACEPGVASIRRTASGAIGELDLLGVAVAAFTVREILEDASVDSPPDQADRLSSVIRGGPRTTTWVAPGVV